MAEKFRRVTPPAETDLIRRIEALEAGLRTAKAARRLEAATIGAGGIVLDGGRIVMNDSTGAEAGSIGDLSGDGDVGITASGDVAVRSDAFTFVEAGGELYLRSTGRTSMESGNDVDVSAINFDVFASNAVNLRAGVDTTDGLLSLVDGAGFTKLTGSLVKVGGPLTGNAGLEIDNAASRVDLYGTLVYQSAPTTSASANAVIESGTVKRSTSSRKYKTDIADLTVDPEKVLAMRPRVWRDKTQVEADPDSTATHVGFIAEELDEIGLGEFVVRDEAGLPDAISYDRLSVALHALATHQNARLDALDARLAALET